MKHRNVKPPVKFNVGQKVKHTDGWVGVIKEIRGDVYVVKPNNKENVSHYTTSLNLEKN